MAKILKKSTVKIIPTVPYEQCLAKTIEGGYPGMTVYEHCATVGHVYRSFTELLPPNVTAMLPAGGDSLAALHDVGKVCIGFLRDRLGKNNRLLRKTYPEIFNDHDEYYPYHQTVSEAAYRERFKHSKAFEICARVLGAHHGFRDEDPLPDACRAYGGVTWSKERQRLINALIKRFGPPPTKISGIQADLMSGALALSDWIASGERFFSQVGGLTNKRIEKEAKSALKALGWKPYSILKKGADPIPFKEEFGFDKTPMQALVADMVTGPGVYLVEASTGSGKTEAALDSSYRLIAAGHHNGLFFALPTRVTSNRIYKRVLSWIERTHKEGTVPQLIHGHSHLLEKATVPSSNFEFASNWFLSSRRALLVPFGVGTVDQILMSILRTKFNFVRTLGLAGKVVVLDEVHSYDVYTGRLLDLIVKRLREIGCTVIMLTATLTHERKEELLGVKLKKTTSYPLITAVKADGSVTQKSVSGEPSRNVHIQVTSDTDKAIAEAIKRAKDGQQVVWVTNLVDRAVAIYKKIEPLICESAVLHSRYVPPQRTTIENHWLDRLGKSGDRSVGSVLIATQVIEQSVDIDADFMITDLAPSDLMIQRIGRLWRHPRPNRPCSQTDVLIVTPEIGKPKNAAQLKEALGLNGKVYNPYVLWKSLKVWKKLKKVSVPEDIRSILDETYKEVSGKDPIWVQDLWADLQEYRMAYQAFAEASTGSHVMLPEDCDYAQTLDPDDDGSVPQTRVGRVPYVPLVLVQSIKKTKKGRKVTFIDGETKLFREELTWKEKIDLTIEVQRNLVMVPICSELKNIESPEWMFEATSIKRALPVLVNKNGCITTTTNVLTPYLMSNKYGVYKDLHI